MTIQADRLFLASTARVARQQDVIIEDERLIQLREQVVLLASLIKKHVSSGKIAGEKARLYENKVASLQRFIEEKTKQKRNIRLTNP